MDKVMQVDGAPPLLDLKDVTVTYTRGGLLRKSFSSEAVSSVSFAVRSGETVGLVGESGCGKTSLGKAIVRLIKPTAGEVQYRETDVSQVPQRRLKWYRREVQMIFQDPASALNPKYRIGESIGEPIRVHRIGSEVENRVTELLGLVGLEASIAQAYPHELSGGQLQRVGIARALAVSPSLIVCDEPTASLDLSVQAQVLNLLADLKEKLGLASVFISHNLPAVASFADRIVVMYMGRVVEVFSATFDGLPAVHPYSQLLIESVPTLAREATGDRAVARAGRDPEFRGKTLTGCRFVDRCPLYQALGKPPACTTTEPELAPSPVGDGVVRCHFAERSATAQSDVAS